MKYRYKPVIIDAEPYRKGLEDGFLAKEQGCFFKIFCEKGKKCEDCIHGNPYIKTLEGKLIIRPTDMIVTGVQGERYPCKKETFDMICELVD